MFAAEDVALFSKGFDSGGDPVGDGAALGVAAVSLLDSDEEDGIGVVEVVNGAFRGVDDVADAGLTEREVHLGGGFESVGS
jgi:hypothetical protein